MNDRYKISVKFGYYNYLNLIFADAWEILMSLEIQKELDAELLSKMFEASQNIMNVHGIDESDSQKKKSAIAGRIIQYANKYSGIQK